MVYGEYNNYHICMDHPEKNERNLLINSICWRSTLRSISKPVYLRIIKAGDFQSQLLNSAAYLVV